MATKSSGLYLMVVLGACGARPDPPDMSLAEFCSQARDVELQRISECLGGPASTWDAQLPDRSEAWVRALRARRGATALNKADECLAALRAVSCDELLKSSKGVCDEVLVGAVPAGGHCYDVADNFDDGVDCAPGNFCTAAHATCPGVCIPRVPAGGPCTDRECVDNADCLEGICKTRVPRGRSCTPAASNGAVSGVAPGTARCESQYDYCERASSTCRPEKAEGSCVSRDECIPTHYCARAAGAATGVCTPSAAIGEACVPGQWQCEAFAYCDPSTSTCSLDGGAGDRCGATVTASAREIADCINSWCELAPGQTSGTCQPFRILGEVCETDDQCGAPMTTCDPTLKVCVAPCVEP